MGSITVCISLIPRQEASEEKIDVHLCKQLLYFEIYLIFIQSLEIMQFNVNIIIPFIIVSMSGYVWPSHEELTFSTEENLSLGLLS